MLIYILICLGIFALAFAGGGWFCYQFCKKAINETQEYNESIVLLNQQNEEQNKQLEKQAQQLSENLKILQFNEQQELGKLEGLKISIKAAETQAKDAADKFYTQSMEIAQERFAQSVEQEAEKYRQSILDFENKLKTVQAESTEQFSIELAQKQEAVKKAEKILEDMQAKVTAAVNASKRAEEMITQQNFYRIQLSEIDIDEIEKLRSVEPYLRDKEPLNKIIWKVYYEKPTNDLIGRVIGSGSHTGIYKITHIDSQKCYVGQAANLADRWKQHIKRGVGADTPTRNKLYPTMREFGPENFTFEVIEECDRSLLDSREDYWQDYFKAKEFGYSIK